MQNQTKTSTTAMIDLGYNNTLVVIPAPFVPSAVRTGRSRQSCKVEVREPPKSQNHGNLTVGLIVGSCFKPSPGGGLLLCFCCVMLELGSVVGKVQ